MKTKASQLVMKDMDMGKRTAVIAHATYGTLDGDKDRSNRGMFDKSWKENKGLLRVFVNHKKDLAPGKPIRTWDDSEHAYTEIKLGTHTLGEDTLKQLDEGIIVAASFGFDPIKYKELKGKGLDYLEVKHYETSVLTHWGAHESSGIVSVTKGLTLNLKQLTDPEAALLRRLIDNGMDNMQACMDLCKDLPEGSDLYTAIFYMISRAADNVGDLKSRLYWGLKEAAAHNARVKQLEKFIRTTTASDDAIADVTKSLNQLLHNNSDTANTDVVGMLKCAKCKTHFAQTDPGPARCAECGHIVNDNGQPDASRKDKGDLRKKMLALKLQMAMQAD